MNLLFEQNITDKNGFLRWRTCFSVDFFPWCDSLAICGKGCQFWHLIFLYVVSSCTKCQIISNYWNLLWHRKGLMGQMSNYIKLLKSAVAQKGLMGVIIVLFICERYITHMKAHYINQNPFVSFWRRVLCWL